MSQPEANCRRYPRYEVAGVVGSFVVPTPVQLANLSLGGMAVETHGFLEFGRSYRIEIPVGGRLLPLRGSVVWCGLRPTQRSASDDLLQVCRAGIRFDVLSDQQLRVLWEFIRSNSVVGLEDSVQARYRIDPTKVTRLTSTYECEVKLISLSGMLVESTLSPEIEDRYELELKLGQQRCETVGRIASLPREGDRVRRTPSRIGVEFCHLGSRDRHLMEQFLEAARSRD